MATAKLRVAYATRGAVPKPTGVRLVSPGHEQVQEIFDDGSVRNPYKVNRSMSGRQRKRMRKLANANMKARGLKGRIEDVLKGRRVGTPDRPQSETQSPAPGPDDLALRQAREERDRGAGTPVAAVLGD